MSVERELDIEVEVMEVLSFSGGKTSVIRRRDDVTDTIYLGRRTDLRDHQSFPLHNALLVE